MSANTFEFACQQCGESSCIDCAVEELTIRYQQETKRNSVKKTVLAEYEENLKEVVKKKDAEIDLYKKKISAMEDKLGEMEKVMMDHIKDAEEQIEQQNEKIKELEDEKPKEIMDDEIDQSNYAENHLDKNRKLYYIWKITEFSKHQDAAKSNKDKVAIYSEEFHSAEHGYKMRLMLFPNGHDNNGVNLSIFLEMIEGEYDEILKWPVEYKIEFQIFNQLNHLRFCCGSFRYDQERLGKTNFFNKPPSKPCVWGLEDVLPLNELKQGYLVNDTIFVKCKLMLT